MNSELATLFPKLAFPFFQAPMAGVSTPALAAAVSQAGGFGALGLGASTPQQAYDALRQAQNLGAIHLNANLFCHAPARRDSVREQAWIAQLTHHFGAAHAVAPEHLSEIYLPFDAQPAMLEAILDAAPPVVSFHFGLPVAATLQRIHRRGLVTAATATSVAEAQTIAAAGIAIIIAQGYEAGGHRGMFDPDAHDDCLTTRQLVTALRTRVTLPIIAAGGIMDGTDMAHIMAAGAAGVQLGTAFIPCPESAADTHWRQRLLTPGSVTTAFTRAISGRPARGIVNTFYTYEKNVPDYPVAYSLGKALHQASAARGSMQFAAWWAGHKSSRCRVMPAETLTRTIIREWQQATASKN